jgi:hypothetical protein
VKKTITIPEDLYDITVDQYLRIQAIPEGDELRQVVETICILCHLTEGEVMAMAQADIQHIGGVIGGILDKYSDDYPVERIIELDQRYGFHPNLSRVTRGARRVLPHRRLRRRGPLGILQRDEDGPRPWCCRFFFAYRDRISRRFGQLFQGGGGSKLSEKYGWFATFVHLAGEDITKLPEVERTHLETALSWLAYEQDRALLEKQKINT